MVFSNLYKPIIYIKRNDLDIGDTVRLQRIKGLFEKGYKPNWSSEIFKIRKILNTVPTRYIIEDLTGEELIGSFYKQELLQIKNGY